MKAGLQLHQEENIDVEGEESNEGSHEVRMNCVPLKKVSNFLKIIQYPKPFLSLEILIEGTAATCELPGGEGR